LAHPVTLAVGIHRFEDVCHGAVWYEAAGMGSRITTWGLPLLARELVEQSARRRTYVVRSAYAAGLFLFALLMLYDDIYAQVHDPLRVLGRGREIFELIVVLQLFGIYTFLPALTCGAIAVEKERNSLGLLFLTKLGPWTIILEKYLAQLLPMLTCVLLSMPLIAFTYALGGVAAADIWTAGWTLAITACQVGAFAIMCSCLFRTMPAALIGTYVLGSLFYFSPIVLSEIVSELVSSRFGYSASGFVNWVLQPLAGDVTFVNRDDFFLMHIPPAMQFDQSKTTLRLVLARSLPTLGTTFALLCLARVCLVRRAFVPHRNLLLSWFKRIDALAERVNHNSLTRGVTLASERVRTPIDQPIAWRETQRRSLGTTRYLVRAFVALQIPLILISTLAVDNRYDVASDNMALITAVVWISAVLLVSVKAASLIAGERSHETLDVLLTTPLTTRELLDQKVLGLRRLVLIAAGLLATVVAIQTTRRVFQHADLGRFGTAHDDDPWLYLVSASSSVAIYLPLVAWLSLLIGMRIKTQSRAIASALAALVAWCCLPLVVLIPVFGTISIGPRDPATLMALSSPAMIIPLTEFDDLDELANLPWLAVFLNSTWYAGCLFAIRHHCLSNADRYLGRLEATRRE